MTARGLSVFVFIMIVLAGCTGMIPGANVTNTTDTVSPSNETTDLNTQPTSPDPTRGPEADTTSTPFSSPTPTDTPTASPTVSDTSNSLHDDTSPTPSPDGEVDPNNPWGERTLTVAIKDTAGSNRQYASIVRDALTYWEQNSNQYAGYPINYRLEPNAANPDIVISFVSSIKKCGVKSRVEGCAPYIQTSSAIDRPVDVQIHTGYTDESTTQLVIHELGHTLGLDHNDEPKQIMAAETDLTTLPKPDVTERALPWNHSTLSVAVDLSNVPVNKHAKANSQINAALAYYDRGADGTIPKRVSFRRVSNPEAADIVIRFSENSPCSGIRSGSCSIAAGYDPDDDGATETYTKTKIVLTNLETDTIAWHVGNRLGEDSFGFDEQSDFPPPLRPDATPRTRSSRWWK